MTLYQTIVVEGRKHPINHGLEGENLFRIMFGPYDFYLFEDSVFVDIVNITIQNIFYLRNINCSTSNTYILQGFVI